VDSSLMNEWDELVQIGSTLQFEEEGDVII
jgi:hypothetical protein